MLETELKDINSTNTGVETLSEPKTTNTTAESEQNRFSPGLFGVIDESLSSKYVDAWKAYKPTSEIEGIFKSAIISGEIDGTFATKTYILRFGRLPEDPNSLVTNKSREISSKRDNF